MFVCKKFIISGRVQGVCYRISTQQQAVRLNLTGHVENLPDGRVQAVFCGAAENIDTIEKWLWLGPVMAKVDDIQIQSVVASHYSEFEIR